MKKILLLAFLTGSLGLFGQTTIYTLDFSTTGGFSHTTASPPPAGPQVFNGANYILGYNTAPATDGSGNFFESDGTKLISRDFGGAAFFETTSIDISSVQQINIVGIGNQLGDVFNGAGEFFRWYYILDGGTAVQGPTASSSAASINTPSSFNSIDVSANSSLKVGFEFNFNGGSDGIEVTSLIVQSVTAGANVNPIILNLVQSPATTTIAASQNVLITADITDDVAVQSANLIYDVAPIGTAFDGTYDNVVAMTATMNSYAGSIPAQMAGNVVYYAIRATDGNMPVAGVTTTTTASYEVVAPPVQGLQVAAVNTVYTIDFDNTVANVNNGAFAGTGLAPVPSAGQLDSDAFAVSGMSDPNGGFGDTSTSGDYIGGASMGGVTSGGMYAFEVAPGNVAAGFQPTGADFTPGSLTLKINNTTGAVITDLNLGFDVYVFNNEGRSTLFTFSHGANLMSLSPLAALNLETDLTADASPTWKRNAAKFTLTGLNIAQGETYLLAFNFDDASGSGSRDEVAIDNINIVANPTTADFTISGVAERLTVLDDLTLSAPLHVDSVVFVDNADLNSNGNLTLTSSAGRTAAVAPITGGSINGAVNVEQFYPAKRAFRFVSPAVDMASISQWQQAGLNPGDMGYQAGIGIHITGGTANGFDTTATNSPSAFTYNNATQAWAALPGTNQSLDAGTPVRLFIRGDRSVDLTSNTTAATDTKLVSTGALKTGDVVVSNLATSASQFSFIGNPYQAQVNFASLLQDATTVDIGTQFFYAWDPTIGLRGAYSTYSIAGGTNNVSGSQVNAFLQPGQAVFVETQDTDMSGSLMPAMTFRESFINVSSTTTATYNAPQMFSGVRLNLYENSEFATGVARDGVLLQLTNGGNNAVDQFDAAKFTNLDENLALLNGTTKLAIESRNIPVDNEIIPLHLSGLQNTGYTFSASFTNVAGLQAQLVDTHTGQSYDITANGVNIPFVADTNANRFHIKFNTVTLGVGDNAFAKAITLYPNPATDGIVNIAGLQSDNNVEVQILNISGQILLNKTFTPLNGKISINYLSNLNKGVYLFRTVQDTTINVQKLIIN